MDQKKALIAVSVIGVILFVQLEIRHRKLVKEVSNSTEVLCEHLDYHLQELYDEQFDDIVENYESD